MIENDWHAQGITLKIAIEPQGPAAQIDSAMVELLLNLLKNAEQAFVPFFTTKREGSGVGLSLTRQVMIAHGGNVRLSRSTLWRRKVYGDVLIDIYTKKDVIPAKAGNSLELLDVS